MVAAVTADNTAAEADLRWHNTKLITASSSDAHQIHSHTLSKGDVAGKGANEAAVKNGVEVSSFTYDSNKTVFLDDVTAVYYENHQDANSFHKVLRIFPKKRPPEFSSDHHIQDLDLRSVHTLPDSDNFYCPNCKSCITKVIILRDHGDSKIPPPSLPPAGGGEILPLSHGGQAVGQSPAPEEENRGGRIVCGNCFGFLAPIGAWISSRLGFGSPAETRVDDSVIVPIPGEEPGSERWSGSRKLEIVKSIVYGGLTECITSLGIVTSAASANTATGNIVALALANLITGLIVIVNSLSGLKAYGEVKRETEEETEAVQTDNLQYEEALGDRQHYVLHFTLAIISFLVSGLLPPLVYGFSFRDADDKDLKLVAVAVASLVYIALLATGKAYVQKPGKWQGYVKTVSYYVIIGVGASGLSYVAGREIDEVLQQLGWFKGSSSAPTLSLPGLGFAESAWQSF